MNGEELFRKAMKTQSEALEALTLAVVRQAGPEGAMDLRLCQSTVGYKMTWWYEPSRFAELRNEILDFLGACRGHGRLGDRAEDLIERMKP